MRSQHHDVSNPQRVGVPTTEGIPGVPAGSRWQAADGHDTPLSADLPVPPVRLSLVDIRKAFGDAIVLTDVNVKVRHGEIHCIVGHNGAGKSTLMNVLGGVYPDYGGSILIDGELVQAGTPRGALALGVAVVHQEFTLVPTMTVAENIMLGGETGISHNRSHVLAAAESVVREIGLQDAFPPLNRIVGSLSASSQQIVEIAKALGRQTKILVLDEPTARLSMDDRERLFELIRRVAATGTSVIFISHILEEVLKIAERVTVLRDGRVVGQGDVTEFDLRRLSSLVVGDERPKAGDHSPAPVPTQTSSRRPTTPLLDVTDISCGAKVRDVTFHLAAGEIVGIAGVVGSGRTTLARALVGAEPVLGGSLDVGGKRVRFRSPRDALRAGVVMLSEDRAEGLIGVRSASENISIMAFFGDNVRYGFVRQRYLNAAVRKIAHDFQVRPPNVDLLAYAFSGGNQQKLLLARALLARPRLLVVDGPTVGVDIGARAQVHRILRDAANGGTGVLVISDDVDEILDLSHRVLVMRHGSITREIEPRDVDRASLVELMASAV